MRLKRKAVEQRGSVIVIAAVGIVVVLVFTVAVVDYGLLAYNRTQLQTLADGAALAGVSALSGQQMIHDAWNPGASTDSSSRKADLRIQVANTIIPDYFKAAGKTDADALVDGTPVVSFPGDSGNNTGTTTVTVTLTRRVPGLIFAVPFINPDGNVVRATATAQTGTCVIMVSPNLN